jgi:hypothetical protein
LFRVISIGFIALMIVLLSSCSSFQPEGIEQAVERQTQISLKDDPTGHFFGDLPIIPIELNGEQFNSVGDWFDNTSVLYIVNGNSGSKIYRYHLYTGVKELFFETTHQIITLEANQNRSYFVVHTSRSSHEANLIILDHQGNEVVNWAVESVELQYVWNPFDENQMFITSFQDDWSFQNYVVDMKRKQVDKALVNQPFIQWTDSSKVAYLEWGNEFSLNAPLYQYNIVENTKEEVVENILAFHTYKELLLTISSAETNSLYQFFDPRNLQLKQSFQLPMINTFSDRWWIPHYDFDPESDSFFYFQPIMVENEVASLQLIKYSVGTSEETVVLNETSDRPINLSPDGTLCLIGFQFEELIDLKKNEIKPLLK